MTSNWALPTSVTQYSEEGAETAHISWQDNLSALKDLDGRSIKTTADLVHIARDPKHDIVQKTYYLMVTGFRFVNLPDSINGLEVKLNANRFGRITDDTIQLCLNSNTIGENRANLDLTPIKIYGSNTDTWGTVLTKEHIEDPSFGLVLRFQSHPHWPHKNSAMIDSIEMRVY